MSFTIVTDVFCDFCPDWMSEGGICSHKVKKREAWERALSFGWKRIDGKMICPSCQSESLAVLEKSRTKRRSRGH